MKDKQHCKGFLISFLSVILTASSFMIILKKKVSAQKNEMLVDRLEDKKKDLYFHEKFYKENDTSQHYATTFFHLHICSH